jgi:NADPH2:quinone reductase
MKAARFDHTGSLSALQIRDVEMPTLGDGQVLVKIAAAGINPSDVKNVQGLMPHTTLPRTPGRDFAGTIVQGPEELVGREVWGSGGELGFTQDGSHAEYVLLPSTGVSVKPQNLSFAEAASVGVPFITAWAALSDAGQITASDTVAILGAAGAVGSAAIQIARWRGATVLGIVRQTDQTQVVADLGAQPIVNDAPETLSEAIKDATGGHGATLILATVGGPMLEPSLRSLAQGGRLVVIASSPARVDLNLMDFYRRELTLKGVNTLSLDSVAGSNILSLLTPGFESGALRPPSISDTFTLDDIAAAYRDIAEGKSGKRVLLP